MKTNTYTTTNVVVKVLRKQLSLLIIADAVLWLIAILVTRELEAPISQTTAFALVALWLMSNGLIYTILRGTSREKNIRIFD